MDLFKRHDRMMGISQSGVLAGWIERTAFTFIFLMVIFVPHSIAASQISFLLGILASFIRLFIKPRPQFPKTRLDVALLVFICWTVITCLVGYYPWVALDKLRGAGLFLVFYFVVFNIRNLRALRFLILALTMSCLVSVLWTPIERLFGRGVEIHGIAAESPLKKALLWEGDALLKANGKKVGTPEELIAELEMDATTKVEFYRPDFYYTVEVKRTDLLNGDALQKLGIESWNKSRNWRAQGFFSHFVTFAEVLQLIISLVFGLFIASVKTKAGQSSREQMEPRKYSFFPISFSPFLFFCLIAIALALLLTVTRGAQLSFLISAGTIVILNGNRKIVLTLAMIILPIAITGLFFLQQSRQVGFFDTSDTSTTYRMTVYREGINLWLDNPRHIFFGIGMDTVTKKEFRDKWRLFDDGKLPPSHFHSTPIQLLVERGLIGLILYLLVFFVFLRTLFLGLRKLKKNDGSVAETAAFPTPELLNLSAKQLRIGIILGCIGATIGFCTSSLVHYNFGDGEVAMVLYLLFGFGIFAAELEI